MTSKKSYRDGRYHRIYTVEKYNQENSSNECTLYAKWRVLGFTQHFTFFTCIHLTIFLSKVNFSWLYFSTMHILWDRPSQYDVLLIIHATKVLKSLVYDSWLQVTFVAFMMSKTSYVLRLPPHRISTFSSLCDAPCKLWILPHLLTLKSAINDL